MNESFVLQTKEYFKEKYKDFLACLDLPCTKAFFLNTNKATRQQILNLIDFKYYESNLTNDSFYYDVDNIGKTKAFELGLIYPQEIAASLTTKFINNDIKTIVDLCSAPGGKTINALNRINKDVLCISNDFNHSRALELSKNLERLGLDNVIITNKKTNVLADQLENYADLVILDAPCSGEGMIRKYPEILNNWDKTNIESLAVIQAQLLEDAYRILKGNGQLIYSTCTYAFEEDEQQILNFLNKHSDMNIVDLGEGYSSNLKGSVKLSPLNNTEGQFICMLKKNTKTSECTIKHLKPIKEKIIDDFIKHNLNVDEYYLYKNNDHYYFSLKPLVDLKNNVVKYGIDIGEIINKRFEPNHNLYRANSLVNKYKFVYDLNNEEYEKYISGNELKVNLENNYYLITYNNLSLGYGKCSNQQLKNKYPKGLRRV